MPELGITATMSYSWDRFMIDPTPGPRVRADFVGLVESGGIAVVRESAALRTGDSTLPRLAGCMDLPLVLLEAAGGAVGMADLIRRAATVFGADELVVVDVGGDVIAEGHESSLRSPLADSLALAAAMRSGIPTRVLIAGPGLDGELSPTEVRARIDELDGSRVNNLTARDVMPFNEIWSWHPSEATALLAAAAKGWRGTVETQRDARVNLTDDATRVYEVNAQALASSSLAGPLLPTTSLEQAEQLLRDRRSGFSELDIERRRAAGERAEIRMPTKESLEVIDNYAAHARAHGVDALTVRRIAELVHAIDPSATHALRAMLAEQRPDSFRPPLYEIANSATRWLRHP